MRPARRATVGGSRRRGGGNSLTCRYGRCGRRGTPAAADASPDVGAADGAENDGQHAGRAQAPRAAPAVADAVATNPDADAPAPDADAADAASWAAVCATHATTDAGVDADAQRQPATVPADAFPPVVGKTTADTITSGHPVRRVAADAHPAAAGARQNAVVANAVAAARRRAADVAPPRRWLAADAVGRRRPHPAAQRRHARR